MTPGPAIPSDLLMSDNKVRLATTSNEISAWAAKARKKGNGKLILVPIDFSAHSSRALTFASELAEALEATIIVLHVVHDPGEMPGYYSKLIKKKRAGRIQDTAAHVFEEFMDDMAEEYPDLEPLERAEQLMVVGLPVTRILEVVETVRPFMVVLGSQGRTGLKHVLLGSKAAQIVQLSPVPVTVVKKDKKGRARRDDG